MYSGYQTPGLDESAATGLLQHLNTEELQALLDDDSKLEGLIKDLPQVQNQGGEKETILASNKSVAEYNLSQEPRLAQMKAQLASTYEKAVEIQKEFEQNKQKLDYHAAQQSLDTTYALLQTEAAKSEEDSEELSDKFLAGDVEVENYLETYIQQRKVAHQRRVKVEKMKEIMDSQAAAPAGGRGYYGSQFSQPNAAPAAAPAPYPAPAAGGWGAPAAPYPSQPYSMPNPTAYFPK